MMINRQKLFEDWAARYDRSLSTPGAFPFDGYDDVLARVVALAEPAPGMQALDVGTGTGNLAARLAALGCDVLGIDFAAQMLSQAREKVPQARFAQVNVLEEEWPAAVQRPFQRIVSTYVWHEFPLATKIRLLQRLATDHLQPGGWIVLGDIAFPTAQARAVAQQRWAAGWDEDEFYWAADEAQAAAAAAGLALRYEQVSSCGGVFVVSKSARQGAASA
jgi:putative AdoMet-dependent methyltransferase